MTCVFIIHPQIFDGNSDTETLRVNLLQSPLLVRRIALQIVEYETTPTFRFDVYGYSGDGEYLWLTVHSSSRVCACMCRTGYLHVFKVPNKLTYWKKSKVQ